MERRAVVTHVGDGGTGRADVHLCRRRRCRDRDGSHHRHQVPRSMRRTGHPGARTTRKVVVSAALALRAASQRWTASRSWQDTHVGDVLGWPSGSACTRRACARRSAGSRSPRDRRGRHGSIRARHDTCRSAVPADRGARRLRDDRRCSARRGAPRERAAVAPVQRTSRCPPAAGNASAGRARTVVRRHSVGAWHVSQVRPNCPWCASRARDSSGRWSAWAAASPSL
jgi:hypothetical protein